MIVSCLSLLVSHNRKSSAKCENTAAGLHKKYGLIKRDNTIKIGGLLEVSRKWFVRFLCRGFSNYNTAATTEGASRRKTFCAYCHLKPILLNCTRTVVLHHVLSFFAAFSLVQTIVPDAFNKQGCLCRFR